MNELLDAALSYAQRGLHVFPCAWIEAGACSCGDSDCDSPGKHPLTVHGLLDATTDPETVKDFWTKFPKANIAIVTGAKSGIAVIDVDDVGLAKPELDKLLPSYNLRAVPMQKTGKGWHLVFGHPGVAVKSCTKFLPGMDSKADGGYVMAAPSIHLTGKHYEWRVALNGRLPLLPDALLSAINGPSSSNGDVDKPRFDSSVVWEGVGEGQRDDQLFRYACQLRALNAPLDIAQRLVLEAAARCRPAFPESEALGKIEQAWKYPAGHSSGTASNKDSQEQPTTFWPEPMTYKTLKSHQVDTTRWLLDNALPINSTSLLVGKPRDGKTTLAMNLALAMSRGVPFLNRETTKCPVFYVSIDNSTDEILEITERLGFQDKDQVYIHTGQIPDNATAWVVEWIEKYSIKFVVIDTYQRFFHIEEVNSTSQVVHAMEPLDFEAKRLGCHVMYLHHAKKNGDNFLDAGIGSNSIKGMCPYYFHIARMGETQQRILSTDFRSGKNFDRVSIKIDSKSGWAYIGGTFEDAIVEDVMPQVIQFLEMEEATEPVIRRNVPARGIFVSKAIRVLYKRGTAGRRGGGRKGDPFIYYLDGGLMNVKEGGIYKGGSISGLESAMSQKPYGTRENSSPRHSGHEWD